MNDNHTIRCPACLAEYSRNDAPAEYLRVLHILDPHHDQQSRLARLSAEVLAKDKLPQMSREEESELKANVTVKDLPMDQQKQVDEYLKSHAMLAPFLEQICAGLRELGVDCDYSGCCIEVRLVEKDCSWMFYHGNATWEGFRYSAPLAHWVSDAPNDCCDPQRITKAIFAWIKRFDYREYRGGK